jgi:type VI secretion system protein ImpE
MTPQEHYQAGQLQQAIQVLNQEIKHAPEDIAKRDLLREFLCIAGDLERADKQLDIIVQQNPEAQIGAAIQRQLIRAEQTRQKCLREGCLPEFVGEPSLVLKQHLQALICLRDGKNDEARQLLEQIKTESPVRDLDDLCAHFLEVLTSHGKYYWIGFDQIQSIEFYPPERPVDLLWRRAHLQVQNGPEGDIYIPAIYVDYNNRQDEEAQLGRKTDWDGDAFPVRGIGQRMFLIDDDAVNIMEMTTWQNKI